MRSTINSKLLFLRKNRNWTEEDVALGLHVDVGFYQKLEAGEIELDVETSQKLAELYRVPVEYFLTSEVSVFHYNEGNGSNSNSGFIQTYNNSSEILHELLNLIKEKDEQLKVLISKSST